MVPQPRRSCSAGPALLACHLSCPLYLILASWAQAFGQARSLSFCQPTVVALLVVWLLAKLKTVKTEVIKKEQSSQQGQQSGGKNSG